MPDVESFVAAIAANPDDDLPRLVFADWLDENGDPARAGFIRDHVQLAKIRPGTDEYKTLFRKCADTLKANLPAWIQPACDAFGQPAEWKPGKATGGRFPVILEDKNGVALHRFEYVRGLADQLTLHLKHSTPPDAVGKVLRQNPITRLKAWFDLTSVEWGNLSGPMFQNIRQLNVWMAIRSDTAESIFSCPHLNSVVHLTLPPSVQRVPERFIRSPMARQILCLHFPLDTELLGVLHEYPLDDRLREFAVQPRRSTRDTPELWSALSRVAFRPTLKRLDLTRCGMTDDGLAAFARGEEWVRLQGLKLAGNLFGDRGWADFCRGWRTPELTYLDASRNRLTDAGAEMLSRSGMLKTLRVIDLRGNRIAGRGAVALARAVAEGKVNRLLLAGNPLGKREAATVKGLLGERVDI